MKALLTLVVSLVLVQSYAQADCKSELKGHAVKYRELLSDASPDCKNYLNTTDNKSEADVIAKCGPIKTLSLVATTKAKRTSCTNVCQGASLPTVQGVNGCSENIGLAKLLAAIDAL